MSECGNKRYRLTWASLAFLFAAFVGGCSSSGRVPEEKASVVSVAATDAPTGPDSLAPLTDPVVGFESNDGKRMIVAGGVKTEAERTALISASKLSFVGYEIDDQLVVSEKAPSIPDAQTMVDALSQVRAPISFVYTGANYRLRGIVSNESTRLAVEASLRASLGPITVPISNELTIAS